MKTDAQDYTNESITAATYNGRLMALMTQAAKEYAFGDAKRKEIALIEFLKNNMDARLKDVYLAVLPDDSWEWRRKDKLGMWQSPAVPRTAVQMIPVDLEGRVLLMHRSDKVRSAKNVWSFPSGLHDIGETLFQTLERELWEEYQMAPFGGSFIGVYENIAGDPEGEQYHWVVLLFAALVPDVRLAVNREPDKHDQMKHVRGDEMLLDEFYEQHPFHKSFSDYAMQERRRIVGTLANMIYSHLKEQQCTRQ